MIAQTFVEQKTLNDAVWMYVVANMAVSVVLVGKEGIVTYADDVFGDDITGGLSTT